MRLNILAPSTLAILAALAFASGPAASQVVLPIGATPMPYQAQPPGKPVTAPGDTSDDTTVSATTPFKANPRGVYKIFVGTVGTFSGYRLKFRDGRSVYLDGQTIIEPTGGTIKAGMQIAVHGYFRATGGITARMIVIENGDGHQH
jgi:hypothetical protein